MPEVPVPPEVKKLTMEVLHPIRDFVIEHGSEDIAGHPLKYVRMDLEGHDEELVICAVATKEFTRMRISMGDTVPADRLVVIVFEDEPESWIKLDTAVDIEDLVTLSMCIQAGYAVVGSGSGEPN